jgi:hypothetical protein
MHISAAKSRRTRSIKLIHTRPQCPRNNLVLGTGFASVMLEYWTPQPAVLETYIT